MLMHTALMDIAQEEKSNRGFNRPWSRDIVVFLSPFGNQWGTQWRYFIIRYLSDSLDGIYLGWRTRARNYLSLPTKTTAVFPYRG